MYKIEDAQRKEVNTQQHFSSNWTRSELSLCIMYLLCSLAGFFMVTVTDPSYPDQPLFEYDIGANCPAEFKLDFNIPTRGPDTFDKHLRVQIHDTFRTIHMNVFRPAPNISQETLGKNNGSAPKNIFQHRKQGFEFISSYKFCSINEDICVKMFSRILHI